MPSKNPLTRADYDKIMKAEQLVMDTLPDIERAAACGVDCQQYRGVAGDILEQIAEIKKQYFTPVPR